MRTDCRSVNRLAFSLIEILVVLTIVGVLLALLLPAIQSVRGLARQTQCQSRLRQQYVGLQRIVDWQHVDNRKWRPNPPRVNGWPVQVSKYVGGPSLRRNDGLAASQVSENLYATPSAMACPVLSDLVNAQGIGFAHFGLNPDELDVWRDEQVNKTFSAGLAVVNLRPENALFGEIGGATNQLWFSNPIYEFKDIRGKDGPHRGEYNLCFRDGSISTYAP